MKDSTRALFDDLQRLNESSRCAHINRAEHQATIILYDLSSIRDYLLKIKFKEGDVIDAFQREYDNYEKPGYWNEKRVMTSTGMLITHGHVCCFLEFLYQ